MPLKIIGTSHIAKQSVKEIAEAMDSFNPEIIAVELDRDRALALMQNQRNKVSMAEILRIGAKGYIFAKILGLVVLSYTIWILASFKILPFTSLSLYLIFGLQ